MAIQTQMDARWLKSIGIDPDDQPQPMVSGRRYAQLVNRNDQLTRELLDTRQEVEFLKDANARLCRKLALEEMVPQDIVPHRRTYFECFLVTAAAIGWILWWYKP